MYGVKLNQLETLTLIRAIHQEGLLPTALPKFLENNYLEIAEGDEKPGLLILELAGQPVSQDYAMLALKCFQMFGCHTKVVEFFLRNGNLSAGLEYLSRLGKHTDFDFVHFLCDKFGPADQLKGDQKFMA